MFLRNNELFFEVRIFEEILNVLLYENRTGSDDDLMQVIRKGTVIGYGYYSDDDVDEKLDREVRMRRKQVNLEYRMVIYIF